MLRGVTRALMSVYRITFENFDLFAWMSEFGAVYFYCFRVDAPGRRVGRRTIGNDGGGKAWAELET